MDRKPVEIGDFTELKYVSDPRFSPDGRSVSFLLTQIRTDQNAYWSDLWVLDPEHGDARQVTDCGQVRDYFWDGGALVYWIRWEDATAVYRAAPETGEERELFSLPLPVRKLRAEASGV